MDRRFRIERNSDKIIPFKAIRVEELYLNCACGEPAVLVIDGEHGCSFCGSETYLCRRCSSWLAHELKELADLLKE